MNVLPARGFGRQPANFLIVEIETFDPDDEERTDFELIFSDKEIGRCSFRKVG